MIARPVDSMYDRSGSRHSVSGVGTQMMMQSASRNRALSVVASNRPVSTRSFIRALEMWPM